MLQVPEQRLPCSPWWRPWWGRLSPAAHGSPRWSRYSPAAHGGPHIEAGGCLKEGVTLWRACTGAGLLAGPVNPWGTYTGVVCSWRTAPRGRDPCWSSSWRMAVHGKDSHWRCSWMAVCCGREPHTGAGKDCEESSPWGGTSGRDNVWWTDRKPRSRPLAPLEGSR